MAPTGEPVEVEDHHFVFTGPDVEQAIPYGIYDLTRTTGWVNVGVDTTPVCSRSPPSAAGGRHAATSTTPGHPVADHRRRRWLQQRPPPGLESELAALAAETGLATTVCHFPPGTSKWNQIEHRRFSHITSTGEAGH